MTKLLDEGTIELSFLPWQAEMSVVRDERHKQRMVVDYLQTINGYLLLDAYPFSIINEPIAEIAKGSNF